MNPITNEYQIDKRKKKKDEDSNSQGGSIYLYSLVFI